MSDKRSIFEKNKITTSIKYHISVLPDYDVLENKPKINGVTLTGNVGLEELGITTIKGEKGDKGETGAAGIQGERGEKGADGKDGTDGINGIGITTVTSGTSTEENGYTVTPITFAKTDGSTQTVSVRAKNGIDGSGGTTIPAEAIIDVDELPQKLEIYTLYNGEKNVLSGMYFSTKLIIVDTLPKEGEDFFTNFATKLIAVFYYQKSDSSVYTFVRIEDTPTWEKMDIIYSDEEAIEANEEYYVLKENDINTQVFYRVPKATNGAGYIYMPGIGVITLSQFAQSMGVPVFEEIVVDELPAVGNPSMGDMSEVYAYTNLADGIVYIYAADDGGWLPIAIALSQAQGEIFPNNGFVDSVDEMTEMGIYVLRTETKPVLYHYKNGWHEVGLGGSGVNESGGANYKTLTIKLEGKEQQTVTDFVPNKTYYYIDITQEIAPFSSYFSQFLQDMTSLKNAPIMIIEEGMDGSVDAGYLQLTKSFFLGSILSLPYSASSTSPLPESFIQIGTNGIAFATSLSNYADYGILTLNWIEGDAVGGSGGGENSTEKTLITLTSEMGQLTQEQFALIQSDPNNVEILIKANEAEQCFRYNSMLFGSVYVYASVGVGSLLYNVLSPKTDCIYIMQGQYAFNSSKIIHNVTELPDVDISSEVFYNVNGNLNWYDRQSMEWKAVTGGSGESSSVEIIEFSLNSDNTIEGDKYYTYTLDEATKQKILTVINNVATRGVNNIWIGVNHLYYTVKATCSLTMDFELGVMTLSWAHGDVIKSFKFIFNATDGSLSEVRMYEVQDNMGATYIPYSDCTIEIEVSTK